MMKRLYTAVAGLVTCAALSAQNPFLPLWEHIPDGEPYVFDDPDRPGRKRLYVYGSHDDLKTEYCGKDQVVWSAPVEDLTQWRYDGVIFQNFVDGQADVLYAPDVVEVMEQGRKVYYLCPNVQNGGRQNLIAKGFRPDGPFTPCNWQEEGRTTYGLFGFDPAIFQDDDGRVYGYWGFERSYAAELDPKTMCTVKPGTEVKEDMVSGRNQAGVFRFFEASSMRKVEDKYVFIYSRFTEDGEFGLPTSNYNLAYAYSDHPLGPWTYGGTIIDGRGRDTDPDGKTIYTAHCTGNTHGSIVKVGDQWWVIYHRQTGTHEYARQAMAAPVDVKVQDGKVIISEGEVTSEGFRTQGLDPLERTAAGLACYYTGPKGMGPTYPNFFPSGSCTAATWPDAQCLNASYSQNTHHTPMVNNTAGSVVGYKYFNFDELGQAANPQLCLHLKPLGVKGGIVVMVDSPWEKKGGRVVGRIGLTGAAGDEVELYAAMPGLKGLNGKHALYMLFQSETEGQSLCDLYDFIFSK